MALVCKDGIFTNTRPEGGAEACPVLSAFKSLTVSNNQEVIAAVAGKRHRIIGYMAQSSTATVGTFNLHSATTGGNILSTSVPASTSGLNDKLPLESFGYGETATGEAMQADGITAGVYLTVFYITYTP